MSKSTIITLIYLIIIFPLLIIVPPNVIQDYWLWFIMPISPYLTPLSFWHAFGLILFIGYFTNPFFQQEVTDYIRRDFSDDDKLALVLKRGLQSVTFALLMWGFGALVAYGV